MHDRVAMDLGPTTRFYARAYVPIVSGERVTAIVAAFVDQTERRNQFATAFLATGGALCLLTAIAFYGHMEIYPALKLTLVHSGAAWVPLALEKAETYLWLFSGIRDVSLEPERVFFARPSLVAFDSWEHAVGRMPDVFERVAAWGSRYPNHDTGTVEEAREMLARHGVAAETVASFLGGNALRHFRLG